MRHERNVLQKICAERSDELVTAEAALKEAIRRNAAQEKLLDAFREDEAALKAAQENAKQWQQYAERGVKGI